MVISSSKYEDLFVFRFVDIPAAHGLWWWWWLIPRMSVSFTQISIQSPITKTITLLEWVRSRSSIWSYRSSWPGCSNNYEAQIPIWTKIKLKREAWSSALNPQSDLTKESNTKKSWLIIFIMIQLNVQFCYFPVWWTTILIFLWI